MKFWLKIGSVITGLFFGLSGCAPVQESVRETQTRDAVPVVQTQAAPIKPTQLIPPSDARVAAPCCQENERTIFLAAWIFYLQQQVGFAVKQLLFFKLLTR